MKGMEHEHTAPPTHTFTASNYDTVTDAATEFAFVLHPHSRPHPFPGECEGGRRRRDLADVMGERAVVAAKLT
eukprot:CAMPEP_0181343060 /NCGR_PEP_ID=MMETSP1101-20121128/31375_1 /TAXON_ID=46948 /ORGANISM="Rhodomonas abbreviata, Strain Caron Lab Isolate" /LENGTH=72 /DNA_ID=CAMNT_0023454645 /DNA_START=63 /DNA_END=277 /DNA_ORIENTATION=+